MNHKPQKPIVMSVAVSIAFHVLLIVALYWPLRHGVRQDAVKFTIHTPHAQSSKQVAAPSAASPKPAPTPRLKTAPSQVPASVSSVSASTPPAMVAVHTSHNGDGNEAAAASATSASLVKSSFKHPEFTDAALAANYEASIVAAIFIDKDGSVGEIRFEQALLHGMQPRLIQAIRSARFTAAQTMDGEAIPTWLRIRFKLVIPK